MNNVFRAKKHLGLGLDKIYEFLTKKSKAFLSNMVGGPITTCRYYQYPKRKNNPFEVQIFSHLNVVATSHM